MKKKTAQNPVRPKMSHDFPLLPAQATALAALAEGVRAMPALTLQSAAGAGKTTLARRLVEKTNGVRLVARDIIVAAAQAPQSGLEEFILRLIEDAFTSHDLVAIDDADELLRMAKGMGYRRQLALQAALRVIMDRAYRARKTLVLCVNRFSEQVPTNLLFPALGARSLAVQIPAMAIEDFEVFLSHELGPTLAARVDVAAIFEHAPNLSLYQLKQLSAYIQKAQRTDAASVREHIDGQILKANVNADEVAEIGFDDLIGFGEIADALTTFVLNPLRSDDRLKGLALTPKRGVLLYGPPGAGKTSIGRALSHQMKGKFFLIDGSFTPDPAGVLFYRIGRVFEQAKHAAPSVIFIDDADVLMHSGYAPGLNRFLLTMLDGLESRTANKVAVILTAMNPNHLPAALLRSGRVELWLETKLPDFDARKIMIANALASLPPAMRDFDLDSIARRTEGFNAADMRRLASDAKALFAHDVVGSRSLEPADHYFSLATMNVQKNKEMISLAERRGFAASSPGAENHQTMAQCEIPLSEAPDPLRAKEATI